MDNIIIKSREITDFAKDLKEALSTPRRVGLKVNPVKCMFGVKSKMFLGHIVSYSKTNPKKTSVFVDIHSPKSIKYV